mmetsp:Transcript_20002/g.49120  ORF Transcript_20002/g.49120 Transcript_20002/m.49120 type:complete len:239 (-) Transcript_20002:208-924(-)
MELAEQCPTCAELRQECSCRREHRLSSFDKRDLATIDESSISFANWSAFRSALELANRTCSGSFVAEMTIFSSKGDDRCTIHFGDGEKKLGSNCPSTHLMTMAFVQDMTARQFPPLSGLFLRAPDRRNRLPLRPRPQSRARKSLLGSEYPCTQCESSFSRRDNLVRHVRQVHCAPKQAGHSFECVHCSKDLSSRTNLERHIDLVHLRVKAYVCQQCRQRFVTQANLDRHVRTMHKSDL